MPREPPRSQFSPFSALAVGIVATLGTLYIVSQFLRNSVGVIAPNLAAEVGLSPIEIGLLSSIYFFVFAATQLPLGVALDRFGPKRCMLVSIAITVAGSAAFGLAQSASGLVWSRALLGFGTSCFLMAPVALYARWFAPEQFSTFTGIHLGVGTLGALLATAPLAFVAGNIRLARGLSRSRHCHRCHWTADMAHRQRRSAGAHHRTAQRNTARKRCGYLAGDPHAFDRAHLSTATHRLSELCTGGRPVGRPVSHAHLWLRFERAR